MPQNRNKPNKVRELLCLSTVDPEGAVGLPVLGLAPEGGAAGGRAREGLPCPAAPHLKCAGFIPMRFLLLLGFLKHLLDPQLHLSLFWSTNCWLFFVVGGI